MVTPSTSILMYSQFLTYLNTILYCNYMVDMITPLLRITCWERVNHTGWIVSPCQTNINHLTMPHIGNKTSKMKPQTSWYGERINHQTTNSLISTDEKSPPLSQHRPRCTTSNAPSPKSIAVLASRSWCKVARVASSRAEWSMAEKVAEVNDASWCFMMICIQHKGQLAYDMMIYQLSDIRFIKWLLKWRTRLISLSCT